MCVSSATIWYRSPFSSATRRDWLYFLGQLLLVIGVELSDELVRGMIAQSNSHTGRINAARIISFQQSHGFWIEPAWQEFFRQTHHLLGLTISWPQVVTVVNGIYLLGHIFITLTFALWVFFFRRALFPFLRNIFFLTNLLALVGYETFPLAPPRLEKGLSYNGHPYTFVDTMFQAVDAHGKVIGTKFGFNEFAAMPSLHIGWALIVGLTLAWTLRSLPLRLLALCYPPIMLVTVVVSGNHYIMDAVGAVGVLAVAVVLSLLYFWWSSRAPSLWVVLRRLQSLRHESRFWTRPYPD